MSPAEHEEIPTDRSERMVDSDQQPGGSASLLLLGDSRQVAAVFGLLLAALLPLKWPALSDPPAWDAAMSVFPAAITMAEEGAEVFSRPGYRAGGPNVHAYSPITIATALVIKLHGDIPVELIRIVHICLTAAAGAVLFDLVRQKAGLATGVITAAAGVTIPMVRAQAGLMYLEIPLLLCTVLAVRAWSQRRVGLAATLSALAVWIKLAGIVVPLAFVSATLLSRGHPLRSRLGEMLPFLPAGALFVVLGLVSPTGAGEGGLSGWVLARTTGYVLRTTDLVVGLAVLAAVGVVVATRSRSSGYRPERFEIATLWMVAWTAIVVVAVSLSGFIYLPRYFTSIFPLMIALLLVWIAVVSRPIAVAVAIAIVVASLMNGHGVYYPDNDVPQFALAERSEAHQHLIQLQLAAATEITQLPQDVPIYYDHGTHYRTTYPQLGYVEAPVASGTNAWLDETIAREDLDAMPGHFYMYFEYDWLGGEFIKEIWEQAGASPDHVVEVTPIRSHRYESYIIHVRRTP